MDAIEGVNGLTFSDCHCATHRHEDDADVDLEQNAPK
jgi:hypothetical protein